MSKFTAATVDSTVSRQWASRPDDQRYTSFEALVTAAKALKAGSKEMIVSTGDIKAENGNGELKFNAPDLEHLEPTHWAWNQLCNVLSIPPSYIGRLPAHLAAQCFQHALDTSTREQSKLLIRNHGTPRQEVAAFTSETYGRIYNIDMLNLIDYLTHNDDRWKIPGEMDWTTGTMRPDIATTKDNTTLFMSDRDLFVFMCQDADPIECGKTDKGEPDYYFPGFYLSGSETGASKAILKTMFLRGVCMNRNLWGVEGVKQVELKHRPNAMKNFIGEALPSLSAFSVDKARSFIDVTARAKQLSIGKDDEEATDFLLKKAGLGKPEAKKVLELVLTEEQTAARNVYQAVQGMTALARTFPHQDKRLDMEEKAQRVLQLGN